MSEGHLKTGGEKASFTTGAAAAPPSFSDYCYSIFIELKIRRQHRFVVYKHVAETGEMEVDAIGHREQSFISLKKLLPFTDCRYCVFDQDVTTADGRTTSKLHLISWFPLNSTPISKMTYTTAKASFRDKLTGVFDVQVASIEELEKALGLKKDDDDDDDDGEIDF